MKSVALGCIECREMSDLKTTARKIEPWNPPGPKRVMVVAWGLTPDKGKTVTVSMEMDQRTSYTAQFLEREILGPLGVDRASAFVTDVVRCFFSALPTELATERGCTVLDILRPAARRCLPHLEQEVATLGVEVLVTLGEPVYDLLREFWQMSAPPIREAFGLRIPIACGGRSLHLIPCVPPVAINAEQAHYGLQSARLTKIRLRGHLGDAMTERGRTSPAPRTEAP
jgi:uracil-DNA glycosylase